MADKLVLNANMICKADRFIPKKCAVEKVIEVSDSEFRTFIENPMKRNYYLPQYKDLMGYYDDSYHGVMFVNMENGDGLLVNSEGYDYARYSQYIPNARGIIRDFEQTAALENLKTRMDCCIDKWLEKYEDESKFDIPLTDLINDVDFGEFFTEYASERLSGDPRIESCELTPNDIEVTKRELVETKLYCPLKIMIEDEDGCDLIEIDSANYIDYDFEINAHIREDLNSDEDAVKRGLAAYLHDGNLDKKVYSIMPMVETLDGNLYGMAVVQSYGELDKAETADLIGYVTSQYADGFGEGLEQHPVTLGGDEVYISLWNSDDYYLKPESELFHDQKLDQTMGGLS